MQPSSYVAYCLHATPKRHGVGAAILQSAFPEERRSEIVSELAKRNPGWRIKQETDPDGLTLYIWKPFDNRFSRTGLRNIANDLRNCLHELGISALLVDATQCSMD
jgi:hypothetical protein